MLALQQACEGEQVGRERNRNASFPAKTDIGAALRPVGLCLIPLNHAHELPTAINSGGRDGSESSQQNSLVGSGSRLGVEALFIAAAFPDVRIGLVGVALAFKLTVLTMAYTVGHIPGCHLNPAVPTGIWAGDRFPAQEILADWVAQVAGAFDQPVALRSDGFCSSLCR
jgi:hypothetical protein